MIGTNVILYFLIATEFLFTALYFGMKWLKNKKRKTDILFTLLFTLLALSFGVYGAENIFDPTRGIQLVIDLSIALIIAISFCSQMVKEIKEKSVIKN